MIHEVKLKLDVARRCSFISYLPSYLLCKFLQGDFFNRHTRLGPQTKRNRCLNRCIETRSKNIELEFVDLKNGWTEKERKLKEKKKETSEIKIG